MTLHPLALALFLAAAFAFGFATGIVVLISAQVRAEMRRRAASEQLDRRPGGPVWREFERPPL
jgi:hypothetical protein